MKTRLWIPAFGGAILLFAGVGQAWSQSKCASGAISRCAQRPTVGKASDGRAQNGGSCRLVGCECKQDPCGKTECSGDRTAQKTIGHSTRRHMPPVEPRKLALPCGSCKRMEAAKGSRCRPACDSLGVGTCLDCRHDTIFGTETIFGDGAFRKHAVCPYGCADCTHTKPLARVVSRLDESLHRIFVCDRGNCGKSKASGCGDCLGKSKCDKDMLDAPILEGQPHELRREENPFRDDSIDADPNAPALLPPAPLPPAASAASQIRPREASGPPCLVRSKPTMCNPAAPLASTCSAPADSPTPASRTSPDDPSGMRRPLSLFSSLRLE